SVLSSNAEVILNPASIVGNAYSSRAVKNQKRLSKSANAFSSSHCALALSLLERSCAQPEDRFLAFPAPPAQMPTFCHLSQLAQRLLPGRKLYSRLARAIFFSCA